MAGVALSQLTNVGPNLGQSYIIDSFMVVVFGGVGNLWGSLIGGMSMGIVNELLEPYAGAVLAKIFVLVALILFIQVRPRGLFPPSRARGGGGPVGMVGGSTRLWISAPEGDRGRRMVSGGACRGGDRRAHPQPGCARVIGVSSLGLRNHAHRQVSVLRDAGAGGRPDLGILRHPEPGARGFLFARRLRHGHVSDAADRPAGRLRRSHSARLHGVSELEVAALVLVRLQPFSCSRSS